MTSFRYRAVTRGGQRISGSLQARNLSDLEQRLSRLDLVFINGEESRPHALWAGWRIPRRELIHFGFHLEELTRAGVPLLEALRDLRDSTRHPRLRETIAALVEGIEGGQTLSQAMSEHPLAFSEVSCALIRAAEQSGTLPDALARLTEALRREDELAGFILRLAIYPAIVLTVILAAVTVAMIWVVPELSRLFLSTGQSLPLNTKILIGLSNALIHQGHWLLLALVASLAAAKLVITKLPGARLCFDRAKLVLPVFGRIARNILLARITSLLATMYASGIPVVTALASAREAAGNRAVRGALERVEDRIAQGSTLSSAFSEQGLFPPLLVRMLSIGESTGDLDRALANVSAFYMRDARDAIARLQVMIEPALTLTLGALLGWVMISLLGPIYDIVTRMNLP
ncbi:type II secretion system F family protein [Niveibacterium terrae]|uniref:type II secretion system F family protein n=1 Tax=Niveibacterium terrae TaxID=3373598 RepID=UPI003A92B131